MDELGLEWRKERQRKRGERQLVCRFAIPLILPTLSSLSPPSSDDPLSRSLDEMGSFPTPEAFPRDRLKI
jgi:hypothetical protein